VNAAPSHLESRLRFWDFSVGQIAAAFVGILIGFVWARFLCPVPGMWAALSGTYLAALPVVPVFVASQTEFDVWGLVSSALRWRRLAGRYVPGAGATHAGYLITTEGHDEAPATTNDSLDLHALWEES
jgi:hypothetical protein